MVVNIIKSQGRFLLRWWFNVAQWQNRPIGSAAIEVLYVIDGHFRVEQVDLFAGFVELVIIKPAVRVFDPHFRVVWGRMWVGIAVLVPADWVLQMSTPLFM